LPSKEEEENSLLNTYRISHTEKPAAREIRHMVNSLKKFCNPADVIFLAGSSLQPLKIAVI
jgi:hypothetical protein